MEYEINIARECKVGLGRNPVLHYAKVTLGCTLENEAKARLADFRERFPASDGWRLSLTCWTRVGEQINA